MNATRTLFVVVCLTMLLVAALWFALPTGAPRIPRVPPEPPPVPTAAPDAAHAAAPGADAAAASAADAQRTAAATTPEPGPPEPAATAPVCGRVLDSRGVPLPAVPVQLCRLVRGVDPIGDPLPGPPVASDALGAFELPAAAGENVVAVAGDGFCTLRTTPRWPSPPDDELLLVAAPAVDLRGIVRGADGAPLPDATVTAWTFLLAEFPRPLEQTLHPEAPRAVTDAGGRFALARTPLAAGVDLLFSHAGYRQRRLPSLDAATGAVDVTLEKEIAGTAAITGTVFADGRPLAGAELRYGYRQATQSAADGSFRFELERRPATLVATHRGRLPIVREGIGQDTPMPLILEFTRPCLAIEGRVVDAVGAPLPGMLVNLVDPRRAGTWGTVETLSAPPVEGLPKGARARCAADGSFRIDGLDDKSYRLRAWDERTAVSVEGEPTPAGSTGVVLTVPADARLAELFGIVVTRDGLGVPGVRVFSHLLADRFDEVATVPGPSATTGDDGRFVLHDVPRRHLLLAVVDDRFVYEAREVEPLVAAGEARLEVLRRCYVQVEGEAGIWVRFLDAAGETLDVTVQSRGQTQGGNAWPMQAATSPVIGVAETAVTLVWTKDGRELGRKAIALVPDGERVTTLMAAN